MKTTSEQFWVVWAVSGVVGITAAAYDNTPILLISMFIIGLVSGSENKPSV